jgi:hypothetical protein
MFSREQHINVCPLPRIAFSNVFARTPSSVTHIKQPKRAGSQHISYERARRFHSLFCFPASHFSRSPTLPTICFSKKRERAPIAQTCRTHSYLKSHTNPAIRTGAVCALPCPHQRQGARAKSAKRRVLVQRQRDAVVVEHVVPLCSTGSCVRVLLARLVKRVVLYLLPVASKSSYLLPVASTVATSEACSYFTCCLFAAPV